ncbi:hypothetical protein [Pontibacter akesuensis]|uniref:Uncharacterized protein n=1 Tax=Pontibacter akesuensis TaxID=388950 RepID=A0A1I7HUE6_9BACT|nr:hypothetical protein [Pontibacter akesuensis]GHA63621.1 hypothetical protein GCM10007389_15260 [Pontibacter akesuensis]SFU64362.1 hypothetical protein SAMN04487941_1685 [Pontibacter akesuensis]
MRVELEEIQLVEHFLYGKLSEAAELDMEVRMLWDREWKEQVAHQQLSYKALQEAGRKQLRQELEQIHQRLFG